MLRWDTKLMVSLMVSAQQRGEDKPHWVRELPSSPLLGGKGYFHQVREWMVVCRRGQGKRAVKLWIRLHAEWAMKLLSMRIINSLRLNANSNSKNKNMSAAYQCPCLFRRSWLCQNSSNNMYIILPLFWTLPCYVWACVSMEQEGQP